MSEPKQVIVMRKDLNMRKGKIAAQAAHASLKVILDMMDVDCHRDICEYKLKVNVRTAIGKWLEMRFTKICVSVDSEKELLEIFTAAKLKGLPTALITDAGLTEFNGVPTKTCIAIGPAYPEELDQITGHLKLM